MVVPINDVEQLVIARRVLVDLETEFKNPKSTEDLDLQISLMRCSIYLASRIDELEVMGLAALRRELEEAEQELEILYKIRESWNRPVAKSQAGE